VVLKEMKEKLALIPKQARQSRIR